MNKAILVLEDGTVFHGEAFGARGTTIAEIVFTTAMTGYQETLTDPSFCGQIIVMTAPHIGNTGANPEDFESSRVWAEGYVVRDPARRVSNWRADRSLEDLLAADNTVGISGIDTRALTRHLREQGVMRAAISSETFDVDQLLAQITAAPAMTGANFLDQVSTTESYRISPQGQKRFTVAGIDLGIKATTPRRMANRGIEMVVLPANSTIDDVLAINPDGVFFSNGPGDPAAADTQIALLREILDRSIPFFGICFGHQLFGRALGLDTYKLRYGHRGVNQPVKDLATGKVEITSQNHGFAVKAPADEQFATDFGPARVTHVCLNDGVVEGLALADRPAFSVQYHPEAVAGPHDADHLFDRFAEAMTAAKGAN